MSGAIERDRRRIDDMLEMLRDIREHLRIGWGTRTTTFSRRVVRSSLTS